MTSAQAPLVCGFSLLLLLCAGLVLCEPRTSDGREFWKQFARDELVPSGLAEGQLGVLASGLLDRLCGEVSDEPPLKVVESLQGRVRQVVESKERNSLLSKEDVQRNRAQQCYAAFQEETEDHIVLKNDIFFKPHLQPSVSILTVQSNSSNVSQGTESMAEDEHQRSERKVLKGFHIPSNFFSLVAEVGSQAVIRQFERLLDSEDKPLSRVRLSQTEILGTCCFVSEPDSKECQTFTIGEAYEGSSISDILSDFVESLEKGSSAGSAQSLTSVPQYERLIKALVAVGKGLGELHGATAVAIRPFGEFDDGFFVSEGESESSFSVGFRSAFEREMRSYVTANAEKYGDQHVSRMLFFLDFFIGKIKEFAIDDPNGVWFASLVHSDLSSHNVLWSATEPEIVTILDPTKLIFSLSSLSFDSSSQEGEEGELVFDLSTIRSYSTFDLEFLKHYAAMEHPMLAENWTSVFEEAYYESFCDHVSQNAFVLEDAEEFFPDGKLRCGPNTDQIVGSFLPFFLLGIFNPAFLLANFGQQ